MTNYFKCFSVSVSNCRNGLMWLLYHNLTDNWWKSQNKKKLVADRGQSVYIFGKTMVL